MTAPVPAGARHLSDPILLELVKNGLDAIVDEMAIALVRTAYSNNLKNAMDMSCALCDVGGRLIAQGLTLPEAVENMYSRLEAAIPPFERSGLPQPAFDTQVGLFVGAMVSMAGNQEPGS